MASCLHRLYTHRNGEGYEGAPHLYDVTQPDKSSLSDLAGAHHTPGIMCYEFYKETGGGHNCMLGYRCVWMACDRQLFLETSINMGKEMGRLFIFLLC